MSKQKLGGKSGCPNPECRGRADQGKLEVGGGLIKVSHPPPLLEPSFPQNCFVLGTKGVTGGNIQNRNWCLVTLSHQISDKNAL